MALLPERCSTCAAAHAGGRRVYDPTHLHILAFIRGSRELGFSLDEVRTLIRLGGLKRPPAAKFARLPRIISMVSVRRSPSFASSNGCWQKQLRNAPAPLRQSAPY